jgi:putative RecB family exonuclease
VGEKLLRKTLVSENILVAPEFLSPSSISTFRQCPLKFKYSKIDGLRDAPTEATVLGNFVHEILETLYGLPSDERTQPQAKEIARQLWSEKWEQEAMSLIKTEREQKMFRWTAWWCVENLWRLEDPVNISPWGIEEHVTGEIGGVKLHGYIDRLMFEDGQAKVCDYKTGKTPKKNYVDDKFFQLIIYTQLLESIDVHADSLAVELLFLKDGVRFFKELTETDVNHVISVIQEVRQGIEERCVSGNFEPKTSILCNWCGFKSFCPAWQ